MRPFLTQFDKIVYDVHHIHIRVDYGILLYSEKKQQDFFGCLARFLGCPGLREADNPEI